MIIEKPLEDFLETAIPMLRLELYVDHQICGRCGSVVRFPLTAREVDIKAFQELIHIAEEYLLENGVQEQILIKILQQIKDRLKVS